MAAANNDTREIWYVSRAGTRYGPYSAAILKTWINTGQLATDVTISNGGPMLTLTDFLAYDAEQSQDNLSPLPVADAAAPGDRGELSLAPESEPVAEIPQAPSDLPEEPPMELPPPLPEIPREDSAGKTQMPMVIATPDETTPVRDRIVILGRRQSGKTIYLATLYSVLWKSLDTVTAKALTGAGHRELMAVAQTLKDGRWPHATQALMQVELEVEFRQRKRMMVTLDFAGELFSKAFLHDQGGAEEVKPLLNHIDHAAAVMLLVDPGVAVGQDPQAVMEDDFGLVQAVQRIRNWPGGDQVPIVVVLTKADLHQKILDRFGGPVGFVRAHFPALVRLMQKVPIFQISAVQSEVLSSGEVVPRSDSVHINVEKPLLYCLNLIDQADRIEEQRRERERQQAALLEQEREQLRIEKKQVRWLTAAMICIFLLGAVAVGAIVVYRF